MKLEYTQQDLIECEEDAYKRGYENGYKNGLLWAFKKQSETLNEVNKKYMKPYTRGVLRNDAEN